MSSRRIGKTAAFTTTSLFNVFKSYWTISDMHIRMIIIIKDTYLHSLTAEGEKTL